jgi:hypothetical protein
LDEDAPVDLPIDLAVLCPPGVTGTYFAKMYTVEFVDKCLDAIPTTTEGQGDGGIDAGTIKKMAYEIIGQVGCHSESIMKLKL